VSAARRAAGTTTNELPLLELRGGPREVGRAHGEFARRLIESNLELYFHRFALEGGVQRHEACRRGALYLEVIDRSAPEYGEMVRGIADGCGSPLSEIAALNARYEILYSEFTRSVMALTDPPPGGGLADGCTAFVALPDATPDGHLRLGENWDWMPGVEGLMLRVERPDGLRVLSFTEAGIAGGKIGLNSAGVGLAINGLVSSLDSWSRLRTPFHVRTWRALNCWSIASAVDAILGEERSCSANFLLAQLDQFGNASAVDVETSPTQSARIDVRAALAHTNHFFDPDSLGIHQPLDERSSSYRRCDRMQALLDANHGQLDDPRLMRLLADHEGYPQSLCAHPSPLWPEEEAYATVLAVVIDVNRRSMSVAPGNPCVTPFTAYALS
jgi:isopenicillin-N N-acyltransferase-like protein